MRADLILKNGRVVTPSSVISGGVAVRDGVIIAVGSDDDLPAGEEVIDCRGNVIFPGVVDPHVHMGGGAPYDEICDTESGSALAGGVTTMIQYRRSPTTFAETFPNERKIADEKMRMDTWFHFILDGMEQVEGIPSYAADYGVTSFKFYMGGYEPGNPIGLVTVTDAVLYVAMEKIRELGPYGFCMVHCEDDSLVSHLTRVMKASGREDLEAYSASRPDFVEEQDLVRAIWLAKLQKCSLYVPHTTVGMAVAAAGSARLDGHRITLETCPHYLALTYDDPHLLSCGAGVGKVAPALRDKSHQDKLWDGLARGYIQTIGSDHVPIKKLGTTLWDEKPGFPGLATSLPVIMTEGVATGRIDMTRAAQVMAYNPAQLFGLHPQKGEIAIGCDADLAVIDMNTPKPVCQENTLSQYTSPFEGRELIGWPVMTVRRGEVAFADGQVHAAPGSGRILERRPDATVARL